MSQGMVTPLPPTSHQSIPFFFRGPPPSQLLIFIYFPSSFIFPFLFLNGRYLPHQLVLTTCVIEPRKQQPTTKSNTVGFDSLSHKIFSYQIQNSFVCVCVCRIMVVTTDEGRVYIEEVAATSGVACGQTLPLHGRERASEGAEKDDERKSLRAIVK